MDLTFIEMNKLDSNLDLFSFNPNRMNNKINEQVNKQWFLLNLKIYIFFFLDLY
jgi:Fe-S-cluster formation regulator IscX/YfhJ